MGLDFRLFRKPGFLCFAEENDLEQGVPELCHIWHPVNKNLPSPPIFVLWLCTMAGGQITNCPVSICKTLLMKVDKSRLKIKLTFIFSMK